MPTTFGAGGWAAIVQTTTNSTWTPNTTRANGWWSNWTPTTTRDGQQRR